MNLRTTITYVRSPAVTAREMNKAVADANAATVGEWHEEFMPIHFTVAANKKYGYQPRKGDDQPPRIRKLVTLPNGTAAISDRANPAYSWRKRRKYKHNKPLVFTGRLEAAARSAIKVSSNKNRAIGTFPQIPRYAYQYRQGQPDKANEMVRVTDDEVQHLARVHEYWATRTLESINETSTVSI